MDSLEKRMQNMKRAYEAIDVPEHGREEMLFAMKQAQNKENSRRVRRWAGGVAAALALMIALPNTSAGMAQALGDLPVVGGLFKVVTLRDYTFDNENSAADVSIPEIQAEGSSAAAAEVNKSVEEYADEMIALFEADLEEVGEEGHTGLNISYDVVTDTDSWLTLRLWTEQTGASAYQSVRYYNIDKAADKVVALGDLFQEGADYVTPISENIKTQMKEQMAADQDVDYFVDSDMPEEDFQAIRADQDYYLDENGDLVISFNEYEVAPGSMGAVTFTIDKGVYADLLK